MTKIRAVGSEVQNNFYDPHTKSFKPGTTEGMRQLTRRSFADADGILGGREIKYTFGARIYDRHSYNNGALAGGLEQVKEILDKKKELTDTLLLMSIQRDLAPGESVTVQGYDYNYISGYELVVVTPLGEPILDRKGPDNKGPDLEQNVSNPRSGTDIQCTESNPYGEVLDPVTARPIVLFKSGEKISLPTRNSAPTNGTIRLQGPRNQKVNLFDR